MSYTGSPYYEELSEKKAYDLLHQPWRWKLGGCRKIFMVMMHEGVLVIDNRAGGCSRTLFPSIMEAERYCEDDYDGGYG